MFSYVLYAHLFTSTCIDLMIQNAVYSEAVIDISCYDHLHDATQTCMAECVHAWCNPVPKMTISGWLKGTYDHLWRYPYGFQTVQTSSAERTQSRKLMQINAH